MTRRYIHLKKYGSLDLKKSGSSAWSVRSSAVQVRMFIDNAFFFKRRRVCTLLELPRVWEQLSTAMVNRRNSYLRCVSACLVWSFSDALTMMIECSGWRPKFAFIYLFLESFALFFVLLPFFLHDDHPSNREHRRSRTRFKLTRAFIATLSNGKSPEDRDPRDEMYRVTADPSETTANLSHSARSPKKRDSFFCRHRF